MTSDSHGTLERIAQRVSAPKPAYDRLLRRRDRRERNRRISAAVLVAALALLSIAGLVRAFGHSAQPATKPTPTPVDTGIFSKIGGWIAFGSTPLESRVSGIWAVDPQRPLDPQARIHLSTRSGEPLAWSNDGSKLLILRQVLDPSPGHAQLYVLNADGSKTLLIKASGGFSLSGGSFSPDGSQVVYAEHAADGSASGIYVIHADGGTPKLLLAAGSLPFFGATFSPDGSQIAYFKGGGDFDNSLWVMNADGSGSRVVLKDRGAMRNSWAVLGYLVWSPDGRRLAFAVGYPRQTYVVGTDGSGLTRLILDGWNLEWSPDGSRIAYNSGQGAGYELAIADAHGTNVETFPNFGASGPWNPLGRAESGTRDTSVTAGATRPYAVIYAIAGLAAVGIVLLWLPRKRRTAAEIKETVE